MIKKRQNFYISMEKGIKQHDITGKASNQDKINILGGTEENMYEKKSHG